MVASNIVPSHTILVDVVEDPHAGLHGAIDIKFSIVRLSHLDTVVELGFVTGIRPGLVRPTGRGGVGGCHLDPGSGPEPAVDLNGLEVVAVTAFEIA